MGKIIEAIKTNPEFFGTIFILVNALWILFTYFNEKRHDRKLAALKQSLDLDLERRKKIFEMKSGHYEAYFNHIDAFHRKHKTDYKNIINPIFNEFMAKYLQAGDNKQEATNATIWLGEQISKVTADMFQEYNVLETETNSLRLTASDNVAQLLDDMAVLQREAFDIGFEYLNKMVEIIAKNDKKLDNHYKDKLRDIEIRSKEKSSLLRESMRQDLQII